jgi:hypothetical protein
MVFLFAGDWLGMFGLYKYGKKLCFLPFLYFLFAGDWLGMFGELNYVL